MINRAAWLFPQNSCDIKQFFITLNVFGRLNGISRRDDVQQILMEEHARMGTYNPYIPKDHYDYSSANHKIDEPRFYGAIFETPNKKIHVSTYGELLLKYENEMIKRNKVFIGMLFNIQFLNPYKEIQGFDIYPLRLIFKLLTDSRLNYKLTNIEVSEILYYVQSVKTEEEYERIVNMILRFRGETPETIKRVLAMDATQFVKNYVSCNYLFNILSDMNVTIQKKGDRAFTIQSPVRKDPTLITCRTLELNEDMIEFVNKYLEKVSVFEEAKKPSGLRSDWIRDIYNSVPDILLQEIGETEDIYTEYLQIPKILVETSTDSNEWAKFEEYITKSFNLFEDVNAETIGGAGQPDSLCHYVKDNIIFCADGKSRQTKLSEINDGRLKQHRELYNARYTIIVTPGYVPSAVEDIRGTDTCIITSYCFADLITKYMFKLYKNHESCSYEVFNNLVLNNLGTDLSEKIYSIIDEKLGVAIDNN